MLRVKAVVSGMSVSLKGNASVLKAGKMLEGRVQVCQDMDIIITPFIEGRENVGGTCTGMSRYGYYNNSLY